MSEQPVQAEVVQERPVSVVRVEPTALRIILSDIIAAAGVILPIVYLGVTLFTFFTGDRSYGGVWLGLVIIGAAIGFGVAWWRVRLVQEIVKQGFETEGKVTKRGSGRSNEQIKWEYKVNGKTYKGSAYVANRSTGRGGVPVPNVGKPIVLLVHPQHPEQSVLRDLYTYTPTKST